MNRLMAILVLLAFVCTGSLALAQEPAGDEGAAPAVSEEAKEEKEVEQIVIVGSHSGKRRTVTDSPVAIDVIQMEDIIDDVGQMDMNQFLQYLAPSFNATRQSGADGADHIDPATLRGLGPDQTLVLINGKRRHQSSLINIFGCRGRGNTGTDLNAIPIAAIERIEILRDGASALYGSDAIAGVINIVLKDSVEVFTGSVNAGIHNGKAPSDYDVLAPNDFDGETFQLNGNYGFKLGEKGFLNMTVDYLTKRGTNRPADPAVFDIYRRKMGDAGLDNLSAWFNGELPFTDTTRLYAFGGYNFRHTDAYAWTRHPDDDRNVPEIYPDGFDPHITSRIQDMSLSAGIKTRMGEWELDFNNTFGMNRFHYFIEGTLNRSLGTSSPTRFDAGGHEFNQNVTGIHLTRALPVFENLNVALGGEFRIDNFIIFSGEEGSYTSYDTDYPAGSQGFPGYQPDNEVDEFRTNVAAYIDAEADFTDFFMVGLAGRYEKYSDFGETVNGKVATRVEFVELAGLDMMDSLSFRASASTGFRAPSLAQIYYNTLFTDFVSGVATDKIIAKNTSPITRALGIPPLVEETSLNFSAGITAKLYGLTLSVDGYYIDIKDRIVLTGAFEDTDPDIGADLQALNVSAAQFFTNAVDTKSMGVDIVLSYLGKFGDHAVRGTLAANFNSMDLENIYTNTKLAGKEDIYFGLREQKFLLASAPDSKFTLMLDYQWDFIGANVRVIRFGEIVVIDWIDEEDVYEPVFTVDVSVSVDITDNIKLIIGAENVLNAYPTQQDTETETGGVWDAVQMGFSGAFYFTKLGFKI